MSRGYSEQRTGWLFVLPALSLITVFFAVPALLALLLSFTDFDIYSLGNPAATRFVGLANYRTLWYSAEFWNAVRNTLYFVAVGGPLSVVASLAAAVMVNGKLTRWKPFFRSALFASVFVLPLALRTMRLPAGV